MNELDSLTHQWLEHYPDAHPGNNDKLFREYLPGPTNEIIACNFGLVVWCAKRCHKLFPRLDVLDLISYGMIGLIWAIPDYDPARGIKFSTFAQYRIWAMIQKYGRNDSNVIFVPNYCWQLRAKKAKGLPTSRLEDESLVLATQALDVKRWLAVKSKRARGKGFSEVKLEWSARDKRPGPDRILQQKMLCSRVQKALKCLNAREREAVERYYGLNGHDEMNMPEISKKMRCTKAMVSKLIVRSRKMLARLLADHAEE